MHIEHKYQKKRHKLKQRSYFDELHFVGRAIKKIVKQALREKNLKYIDCFM